MALPILDPTTPVGTQRPGVLDDEIRLLKSNLLEILGAISAYPNVGTVTATWTTASRPTSNLVDKLEGYNSTLGYIEYWDATSGSWKPKLYIANWTYSTRPSVPVEGMIGFNTDIYVFEMYKSSAWVRIAGGNKGDIKMFNGTYATAETDNPGWVLCDGVTRTHPDGSSYTPINMLDKFPVAAGSTYTVGATGGEATHKLTTAEMPNHSHQTGIYVGGSNGGSACAFGNSTGPNAWITDTSAGGGGEHNNLPPYVGLIFMYKI